MELLYLLCSILSSFLTSLALSLLLPFRILLSRRLPPAAQPVALYQGTVWHERRRPVHHSFLYTVRYALFDLDLASHVPPDHLSATEARRIAETSGPVFLLTIPPSVGYVQNPLSLYYCYDVENSVKHLKKCIAEVLLINYDDKNLIEKHLHKNVTNTPWGERVSFVFNPNSDLVAKPLHVSPFMDMLGNWNLKVNSPGDSLSVAISVKHPVLGDYFVATLNAKRIFSVLASEHAQFFWLMPHKVAVWIYWHALKLWWKNVPFVQHPRYSKPSYREEALTRDKSLQCCPLTGWDNDDHKQNGGTDSGHLCEKDCRDRWVLWREAKWPWS